MENMGKQLEIVRLTCPAPKSSWEWDKFDGKEQADALDRYISYLKEASAAIRQRVGYRSTARRQLGAIARHIHLVAESLEDVQTPCFRA